MERRFMEENKKLKTSDKVYYVVFLIVCCIIIGIVAKILEGKRVENSTYYNISGTIISAENRRITLEVDNDEGGNVESGGQVICYLKQGKLNGETRDGMLIISDNGAVTNYYAGDKIKATYLKDTYKIGVSLPEITMYTIDFDE
jgi:hypothetical protein